LVQAELGLKKKAPEPRNKRRESNLMIRRVSLPRAR
jgi:hypothetical protein